VLDFNTKVKVVEASDKHKLSLKEIVTNFNMGKTQVYNILKVKSEVRGQWQNCSSGSIRQKLRRTGNEVLNEIVWE
jgi:hypothetical protein